ncbi:MAG TPA: S1C family serine protease [Methylomirabilota bacterium]|jgi:S1-C subfamily serine protease|nr:S1C family serine protease [Methylomirabilota bacterium]
MMDVSVEFARHLLGAVVNLHTIVPKAHPSSRILGNERMGSGVVVDPSGLVLTVNYVVMGANTVDVGFLKGRRVKAEVVAQDFEVGLAVIRLKRQGLTAVPLAGGTDLDCGDPVVAVASTGPQERRIGSGLVTYLGEFEAYWEYMLERGIVTSAPNPGFGGGGLFSMTGALLGIVSLNLNEIVRCSLAIPVDNYREHASELLRYGRVVSRPKRAWLGVFAHAVDEGVVVAGIVPEGPGDRGGLQEGDVIVSLNAEEVPSRKELYLSLWRHGPGERLTLEVMRDKRLKRLEVTTGDRAEFFKQI